MLIILHTPLRPNQNSTKLIILTTTALLLDRPCERIHQLVKTTSCENMDMICIQYRSKSRADPLVDGVDGTIGLSCLQYIPRNKPVRVALDLVLHARVVGINEWFPYSCSLR